MTMSCNCRGGSSCCMRTQIPASFEQTSDNPYGIPYSNERPRRLPDPRLEEPAGWWEALHKDDGWVDTSWGFYHSRETDTDWGVSEHAGTWTIPEADPGWPPQDS